MGTSPRKHNRKMSEKSGAGAMSAGRDPSSSISWRSAREVNEQTANAQPKVAEVRAGSRRPPRRRRMHEKMRYSSVRDTFK